MVTTRLKRTNGKAANGRAKVRDDNEPNPRSVSRIDTEVGNRIRMKRIDAGMNQSALGARLGVSFQQVQKYEKGVNRASARNIVALCRALKCDPNYLLGWDGADTVDTVLPSHAVKMALRFAMIEPHIQTRVSRLIDVMSPE